LIRSNYVCRTQSKKRFSVDLLISKLIRGLAPTWICTYSVCICNFIYQNYNQVFPKLLLICSRHILCKRLQRNFSVKWICLVCFFMQYSFRKIQNLGTNFLHECYWLLMWARRVQTIKDNTYNIILLQLDNKLWFTYLVREPT